jgi:hypothetical protein
MRRKGYKWAVAVLVLTIAALHHAPSYYRLARSAQDFQEYFQALDDSKVDLSPLDRLVFSLILTSSGANAEERGAAESDAS